jgi:hypothetical protein
MRTAPVADLLLIVLEFVALFAATWGAWFAVVTGYQILTRKSRSRTGDRPAPPPYGRDTIPATMRSPDGSGAS